MLCEEENYHIFFTVGTSIIYKYNIVMIIQFVLRQHHASVSHVPSQGLECTHVSTASILVATVVAISKIMLRLKSTSSLLTLSMEMYSVLSAKTTSMIESLLKSHKPIAWSKQSKYHIIFASYQSCTFIQCCRFLLLVFDLCLYWSDC